MDESNSDSARLVGPFSRIDPSGIVVWMNQAELDLLGYSKDECIGRSLSELCEDAGLVSELLETVSAGGTVRDSLAVLKSGSGNTLRARISAEPVYQKGVFVGADLAIAHAIGRHSTLSPERRSWLSAVVSRGTDLIVGCAFDGTVRFVSAAALDLLGLAPEGFMGQPLAALAATGDTTLLERSVGATLRDGKERVVRLRMRDAKRSSVWMECSIRLVGRDADVAEPPASWDPLVMVARDVGAQVQLEEELRQAQKMEALGELAASLSHDFNNLLMVMQGQVQILQAKQELGQHRGLERIQRAVRNASELIRRLMLFSGRLALDLELADFRELITQIASPLPRLLGERADVRTSLSTIPGMVRVDASQMEQIVFNLALNARDAMPDGGVVTIGTSWVDVPEGQDFGVGPGRYAVLTVADSGIGMDEATKRRVFEPFFTTKSRGRGTGLGLSVVYNIVRQLAGRVEVESWEGRGTTFRVYLPLVEAMEASPKGAPEKREVAAGRVGEVQRVLVIEDDPQILNLLDVALSVRGHRVWTATNGVTARRVFAQRGSEIDVVVSDVVLPDVMAPQLVRELREQCPQLRAIFISGYPEGEVAHECQRMNDVFLRKPFEVSQLVELLRPDES